MPIRFTHTKRRLPQLYKGRFLRHSCCTSLACDNDHASANSDTANSTISLSSLNKFKDSLPDRTDITGAHSTSSCANRKPAQILRLFGLLIPILFCIPSLLGLCFELIQTLRCRLPVCDRVFLQLAPSALRTLRDKLSLFSSIMNMSDTCYCNYCLKFSCRRRTIDCIDD